MFEASSQAGPEPVPACLCSVGCIFLWLQADAPGLITSASRAGHLYTLSQPWLRRLLLGAWALQNNRLPSASPALFLHFSETTGSRTQSGTELKWLPIIVLHAVAMVWVMARRYWCWQRMLYAADQRLSLYMVLRWFKISPKGHFYWLGVFYLFIFCQIFQGCVLVLFTKAGCQCQIDMLSCIVTSAYRK